MDGHKFRTLGIIPARGGSKGVKRKNIRDVAGVPLIAYTIRSALSSSSISEFVTSTDDEEIAEVAASFGSKVIMRPPELAADDTPMLPVLSHAFSVLEKDGAEFDFGIILQPTAPLRTGNDIDRAIDILESSGADTVISVYKVEDCHPSRMYKINGEKLVPYAGEPKNMLRQKLEPLYHRNGAIYAFRRKLLFAKNTFIGQDTRPYIMPKSRSINIDDESDLEYADFILRKVRTA